MRNITKRKNRRNYHPKHVANTPQMNERPTKLQIALQLVRSHIDERARISPKGNEIWYYDLKGKVAITLEAGGQPLVIYRGAQRQLSIADAERLVDELY